MLKVDTHLVDTVHQGGLILGMVKWIVDKTAKIKNIQSIGSGGNINKILTLLQKIKGGSVTTKEIKTTIKNIKPYSLHDRVVKLELRPYRYLRKSLS